MEAAIAPLLTWIVPIVITGIYHMLVRTPGNPTPTPITPTVPTPTNPVTPATPHIGDGHILLAILQLLSQFKLPQVAAPAPLLFTPTPVAPVTGAK